MYSTELIKKFPVEPTQPILFVVYNETMVKEAEFLIGAIHGPQYLEEHVTVVPFDRPFDKGANNYMVYIDPTVFKYKHSWNN